MPRTRVYDFINGGVIDLALPCPTFADAASAADGRHGLRPLLVPGADALALLRDHAALLAARAATH